MRSIGRLFLPLFVLVLFSLPVTAQEDHVLVRGAPLAGSSNGLAFDSEGNLVIANVWASTVTVMDAATGEILQVYGPELGIAMPDDVALGPDGALYITLEGPGGGVGRISPEGEYSTLTALPFANPLAFSDDGRLFVAQCFSPEDNGFYEVDPQGVKEPRLIFGGKPGCALNAFDFGPDGLLYAPSPLEGKVVRVDVATGEISTVIANLGLPGAVEFDSRGRLHIVDQATGNVYRFDLKTGTRETLAALEVGLDNLVFDAQDRLYVSSAVDGFIIEVLEDGATRVVSEGGIVAPAGITVQGDSIFVAEPQAIREFDRQTGVQTGIERSVFSASDIGQPITIAADGDDLITTSWMDNSVRICNWQTHEVHEVYTDFATPVNALRFQGDLIVAELGTTSIVRASGEDPTQRQTLATLTVPGGLAASEDDLWASDWATGTVWQLVADGETLAEPQMVGSGFAFPEGLAVTPNGQLIVIETGTGNLVELDPESGQTQILAEGLAIESPPPQGFPLPPTFWFNGVAVAEDSTIYAGGRAGNVIYQFERSRRLPNPPLPAGTTYYVTGSTANARECPRTDCARVTTFTYGDAIDVVGTVEGENTLGSSQWREVRYEGEVVYVHSALTSFIRNLALGATVQASRSARDAPPSYAVDGTTATSWGAGAHPPQWIEIDLGEPSTMFLIRLVTVQTPSGNTRHQVWVGPTAEELYLLHTFERSTFDNQTLEFSPDTPLANVRYVKVVTLNSPSWVGWREIEVLAQGS